MSANCSNTSVPFVAPSHPLNEHTTLMECFHSAKGRTNLVCYLVTNTVVFIPLYAYVQYLGLRRWRRRPSAVAVSHSDAFTYHMILMEQLSLFGALLTTCGLYSLDLNVFSVGNNLSLFNSSGQNAFHLLTCLELYLAVTYPVAYLNSRNKKWVRRRNAAIGLTWLFSAASVVFFYILTYFTGTITYLCVTGVLLGIVFYCALNVLCVLVSFSAG